MPRLRGRLLVWPGDEEAGPSGPVLRDLRHLAGEVAAVWLDGMFIADELVLDVGVPAAQARLVTLARRGGLSSASKAAHADELSAVIRVGPFGDAAAASKLVRVRYLDPVCRGDVMTLALRWEATGVTGALFPVLDADITLTPAGHQATRLALAGSYRAPLGGLGAGLDKAILNRVATATIRALLRNVADSLAGPGMTTARQAEPASGPAPWPYIAPEMPW